MRFIALLFDWLLYALLVACMTIGSVAIHSPDVLQAYPQDLPPLTEDELWSDEALAKGDWRTE